MLRFYLDEDTDARLASVFRNAGYECWTTEQANRLGSGDREQAVYADDLNAIFVTHDVAFTREQRRQTIGRHLFVGCSQLDSLELVERSLPDVAGILHRPTPWVIELRPDGHYFKRGAWS